MKNILLIIFTMKIEYLGLLFNVCPVQCQLPVKANKSHSTNAMEHVKLV